MVSGHFSCSHDKTFIVLHQPDHIFMVVDVLAVLIVLVSWHKVSLNGGFYGVFHDNKYHQSS